MNCYYVAIKVGSSGKTCIRDKNGEVKKFWNIQMAVSEMADEMNYDCDHWRVIEVPKGEPDDYDGTVVAEIRTGRLM